MAYFFNCIDKESLIQNGGQIVENIDGSVSVYQSTNEASLVLQHLSKHCCECLDTRYTWDPNKQLCMWGDGCDGEINPFKVVLNPIGNDGVIFQNGEDITETCSVGISFDYLFQIDCDVLVNKLIENNAPNDVLIEAQINYDECITTLTTYQSELESLILELEQTPYVITCNGEITPIGCNDTIFEVEVVKDNKLPINFLPSKFFPANLISTYCLTDLGLQQWEIILGTNNYNAWLNSYGTDTLQYTCDDVSTLVTEDNGTGTMLGSCNVLITARQVIEQRIIELNELINNLDCESLLVQIQELQLDKPCSTVTEILEALNVSMTLEVVNSDTNLLETVYELPILNIGTGNLATYLVDTEPNTGILTTGNTSLDNCEILAKNLMTELIPSLPEYSTLEIQTLVQNSLDSNWLNFNVNISDEEILNLLYDKKIKISFKIYDCCIDFAILVDNIKIDRNCSKLLSTELTISKSPSFDMVRILDNKKSWLANDNFEHREFDLKFRETEYDVNNYKLIINSKEVELDINPSNAIEQDVFCYVRDNLCLLSGTTEISGQTCGDNGIDLNLLLSTEISGITNSNDFKNVISSELINVKGWKTIGSHPTLRLLYDRYMNSLNYCGTESSQFDYFDMINFSELVGTYWVDLIEQVVPSTTIWGSTYVYGNTIFDQQKFKYKKYTLFGCELPNITVVSPTTGWTNDVQVEWQTLPNDNTITATTISGFTETQTSPFSDITYERPSSSATTLNTCIGVGIIQSNCGSEFIGSIINYSESGSDGDIIIISECAITINFVDLVQTSPGIYSAYVSVTGDVVGPISYSWSDGQTTQLATNLTQGIYYVTVTDNGVSGCTDTYEVRII